MTGSGTPREQICYPSPQGLAGYPIYQFNPTNATSCYPVERSPNIQLPQVKQERKNLSKDIVAVLCSAFERSQYVNMNQRIELATTLGITATQVKTWFANKRVKNRKDIAAPDSVHLQLHSNIKSEPMTPTASLTSFDFPTIQQDSYSNTDPVQTLIHASDTVKPTFDTSIYKSLVSTSDPVNSSVYDEFMPQYIWYT